MKQVGIVLLSSFLISIILTPLIRKWAVCYGYVAQPKEDRWHQTPIALMGGVGIICAFIFPLMFYLKEYPGLWIFLLGSFLMFSIGLIDDIYHLQPYSKLVGQIVAACVVMANGIHFQSPTFPFLSLFLTFIWIIGITNAFNLLDNMDGLSGGTACIAAFCLLLAGLGSDSYLLVLLATSLVGTTLGFLVFNFPPAKIFMGDSGSLFLGFTLATLSISGSWEQATNLFFALLIPVLVLAVPIFDTTFVALVRFLNGKTISQGGKDHVSHRLVAFGLPEKSTVLLFYLMSMICGVTGLIGLKTSMLYPPILAILIIIVLCYFGVFLSGIVSYKNQEGSQNTFRNSKGFSLTLGLMYKIRIGEVLVDSILIGISFFLSFVIRYDGLPSIYVDVIYRSLPILIPLKLLIFYYFGMYRGLWRYVGLRDLINILKAISFSSILSVVLIAMIFRFELYPRSVFIIDWMVLLLAISGVRVLIRIIREYLRSLVEVKGKRLLIVGAGDAGEIALREIRNNTELDYNPTGFIDDSPRKLGGKIHGIPILGTRKELESVVRKFNIEEILVAIPSAPKDKLKIILSDCQNTGLKVRVLPRVGAFSRLVKMQLAKSTDDSESETTLS